MESIEEINAMLWVDQAACKGSTALFFPVIAERPETRDRREALARQICSVCPVFKQCEIYIGNHSEYGLWAGRNEEERLYNNQKIPGRSVPRSPRKKRYSAQLAEERFYGSK